MKDLGFLLPAGTRTPVCVLALLCSVAGSQPAIASEPDLDAPVPMWSETYPDARDLLDLVHDSLPDVPLRLEAELRSKSPRTDFEPVGRADVQMWWVGGLGEARYIVRDWFGREEEELTVIRAPGEEPRFLFRAGDPLQDAPLPDLAGPIRDTDLTWGDLTLSFLWWPGGRTVGQQSVRGRKCYIVEVPAPAVHFDALSHVRIWIDPRIGMLLRAETYSADGRRLRTMDAKRFRKIDDMWMVSNLEIVGHERLRRTTLLVRSLTVNGEEQSGTLTADESDVLD